MFHVEHFLSPPPNSYSVGDAIDFTNALARQGGVAGIVTSPPYNRAFKRRAGSNWLWHPWRAYIDFKDNRAADDYVAWQRQFLAAAVRAVGEAGVVVYNIGRCIKHLREDRRQAIIEGFNVRQTVIWSRGSTLNQGGATPTILPPTYELVYIIAGDEWRLPTNYVGEMRYWGDVWRIDFDRNNTHPAPFPLQLATRMVKLVNGPVADPFAGSGTVGLAAIDIGVPYFLNDCAAEYRDMFNRRREQHATQGGLTGI